jgi:hypothetical protein
MAQGGKGKLNYRCPLCFRRDIDMDMLFDKEKNEYYCLRCSFTGSETQVQVLNAETKRRYADRRVRITDFGPRDVASQRSEDPRLRSGAQPVPISIESKKVTVKPSKSDVKIRKA